MTPYGAGVATAGVNSAPVWTQSVRCSSDLAYRSGPLTSRPAATTPVPLQSPALSCVGARTTTVSLGLVLPEC
jgi:hypothetical protein